MYQKLKSGEVWRLLTYGELHGSLTHLCSNILSQLIIGTLIEAEFGLWKTSSLYFLSSIGGGLFSTLINKGNSVGASVAIFGLLGSYVSDL
jgi:rhomboid protease GluP